MYLGVWIVLIQLLLVDDCWVESEGLALVEIGLLWRLGRLKVHIVKVLLEIANG